MIEKITLIDFKNLNNSCSRILRLIREESIEKHIWPPLNSADVCIEEGHACDEQDQEEMEMPLFRPSYPESEGFDFDEDDIPQMKFISQCPSSQGFDYEISPKERKSQRK